jgi:hypothetical protein
MKYDAGKIMMSDKKGVNDDCGENNLYREGMDFDTVAKTDTLTEDMPKVATKGAVDPSVMQMADDNRLYDESGK